MQRVVRRPDLRVLRAVGGALLEHDELIRRVRADEPDAPIPVVGADGTLPEIRVVARALTFHSWPSPGGGAVVIRTAQILDSVEIIMTNRLTVILGAVVIAAACETKPSLIFPTAASRTAPTDTGSNTTAATGSSSAISGSRSSSRSVRASVPAAAREDLANSGSRFYFLNRAAQLRTIVTGAERSSSTGLIVRNRPSRLTS